MKTKSNKYTIQDLQDAVKNKAETRRLHYKLARELGFSGDEAAMIQNRSEETIRRLAKEKEQQVKE